MEIPVLSKSTVTRSSEVAGAEARGVKCLAQSKKKAKPTDWSYVQSSYKHLYSPQLTIQSSSLNRDL